jgi:hypothetical protein
LVGSDADRFNDLAKEVHLPEDRRETCLGDYSNASWSWDKALKPYLRAAGQEPTKFDVAGSATGLGNAAVHHVRVFAGHGIVRAD